MDMKVESSDHSTPTTDMADATICSTDSAYIDASPVKQTSPKQEGKIKAYVDFTEFNKNYLEYKSKNRDDFTSDNYVNMDSPAS